MPAVKTSQYQLLMQAIGYKSRKGRGGGKKKKERKKEKKGKTVWLLPRIYCEPITMTSKVDSSDWPSTQGTKQVEGLPEKKKKRYGQTKTRTTTAFFAVTKNFSC